LLIEELPWTLHKLLLRLTFLPSKKTDGFKSVTCRQKTTTGAPALITFKHHRQPPTGVRISASLPIISKNKRFKAHFVSRFNPEVTADDVEKSLKEELSQKELVCTRLKIKFNLRTFSCFDN
jgi:hypothetical protein